MTTHLIIQSAAEVATADLKQLAKVSGAKAIEALNAQAFRLLAADPARKLAVAAHCERARLDFGFVPQQRKPTDFGLAVMDMDSTLISIECIDEIADMADLKPQVAAITAAAMRGEIDFQQSLRQRVALLKGLPESALERVYQERLSLSPGAEILLAGLRAAGIKLLLVSGGFRFFTDRLKARLGLDFAFSNCLEIVDGKLTGKIAGEIIDAAGKAALLIKIRDELGLTCEQVIGIGDGANDVKMLAASAVSIAYHAKPVVQSETGYALNFTGLDGVLPLLSGS
ncbi:MAG: phosphoserine phosphatase SerB [Burkholderiales bacterium]|nr:phosphoserine phosphatase SerB [Burkholderiales bacterium]